MQLMGPDRPTPLGTAMNETTLRYIDTACCSRMNKYCPELSNTHSSRMQPQAMTACPGRLSTAPFAAAGPDMPAAGQCVRCPHRTQSGRSGRWRVYHHPWRPAPHSSELHVAVHLVHLACTWLLRHWVRWQHRTWDTASETAGEGEHWLFSMKARIGASSDRAVERLMGRE